MKCGICGNEQGNRDYQAREMMFGFDETFAYFQCAQCECLQIAEVPADLGRYYADGYYSYSPARAHRGLKAALIRWRDRYALSGRGVLGSWLYLRYPNPCLRRLRGCTLTPQARILDVGCGGGLLLYALRELGLNHLLGVDPYNPKDLRYPNGLTIEKKDIHHVEGQWDLIMFHDSFEHTPDPCQTLARVSQLLSPSGQCLLAIPVASSYAWTHYGVNWVQLDAPRHLFLHSDRSIRVLAPALA